MVISLSVRTLLSGTGHNADEVPRVGMHQDLGCIKSYDEPTAYIRFDGVCILMAGEIGLARSTAPSAPSSQLALQKDSANK